MPEWSTFPEGPDSRFSRHALKPPAQLGRGIRGGRRHVKHRALVDRGANEVEIGTQHHQYGEEGEPKTEGPDAAAQRQAEPVDEPAKNKYDGEQRHQLNQVLADVGCHDSKLQEVEEEERQRLVDVVLVKHHFLVREFALI